METSSSLRLTAYDKRASVRHSISLPARLTWKDQRGTTRFATVVTRDISEFGVYVECQAGTTIPLFRLVQLQLERDTRDAYPIPAALRQGRVLTAVYRVVPPNGHGKAQGLALRMMVDPKRRAAETPTVRATA